jgi:tRNA A37 threonylcarbamoyladenosine modification protein TsaB
VLATLNAHRGEVYASRFRRAGKFLRPAGPVRICTMEEARRDAPAGIIIATEPPRAAMVAALGLARFNAGKCADPRTLVPVYVRRPEAVERRLRGQK